MYVQETEPGTTNKQEREREVCGLWASGALLRLPSHRRLTILFIRSRAKSLVVTRARRNGTERIEPACLAARKWSTDY
jgi:hypothetical protein